MLTICDNTAFCWFNEHITKAQCAIEQTLTQNFRDNNNWNSWIPCGRHGCLLTIHPVCFKLNLVLYPTRLIFQALRGISPSSNSKLTIEERNLKINATSISTASDGTQLCQTLNWPTSPIDTEMGSRSWKQEQDSVTNINELADARCVNSCPSPH